ncbi:MAG: DUF192 domain-containing protein [Peptococcaceae bacterium]|nr:DUF192 domain-containing protein [Peptococcaceae bacterium]
MKEFNIKNLRTDTYLGKVAIAEDTASRMKGLLGTQELPFFHGIILKPCKQVHTMGMRYPISVWYINRQLQVIKIVDKLQPWRIAPFIRISHLIIEFPQRWAEITGSQEGDDLLFI